MTPPSRVVVIGAGPAGLLAAAAVAGRADEVVVLDRDRLPREPVPRDGAPQDRHWNQLDRPGLAAIETLLPGLAAEAVAAGGRRELGGLVVRRPLVEALLRRRVAALAGVELRPQTAVLDLSLDHGSRRVHGVVVTDVEQATAVPRHLRADLVIDASGQHTRTPVWLARRRVAISQSRVAINATFVTREFTRRPSRCEPVVARHVRGAWPDVAGWRRSAVVVSLGERWGVTLGGTRGLQPPTDVSGFAAYASEVDEPLGRLLRGSSAVGSAVGDAAVHRLPSTVVRQVAEARGFVDGLVLVGDAWRTHDPLTEPGLTAAAESAVALALRATRAPLRDLGAAQRGG